MVASSLILLFVILFLFLFLVCRDDVLCCLFLVRSLLSVSPAYLLVHSRFDLVWFRLSCDHGWIRSGSVNVR